MEIKNYIVSLVEIRKERNKFLFSFLSLFLAAITYCVTDDNFVSELRGLSILGISCPNIALILIKISLVSAFLSFLFFMFAIFNAYEAILYIKVRDKEDDNKVIADDYLPKVKRHAFLEYRLGQVALISFVLALSVSVVVAVSFVWEL